MSSSIESKLEETRVDRWVWCARMVKTRTAASALVREGKVKIEGRTTIKPASTVTIGDVLTVRLVVGVRVYKVRAIPIRRGSASIAQGLYEDLTPPTFAITPQRAGPRPTKKARRVLLKVRGDPA
ncbi:MAG: S4 domain-containing protein [Pseudomonadota bacterium]